MKNSELFITLCWARISASINLQMGPVKLSKLSENWGFKERDETSGYILL